MGIVNKLFGSLLGGSKPASRITIKDLSDELEKLKDGNSKYDFFGIVSAGVDCIYFVNEGDRFQIEFEAMEEDQVPYIKKLKEFADSNGFASSMTTYGNKSNYSSSDEAPVIRIETHTNTEATVEIAKKIQSMVFQNGDDIEYDVVP